MLNAEMARSAPESYVRRLYREHQERLVRLSPPARAPVAKPGPAPLAPIFVYPTCVFTEDGAVDDTSDLIIVGPTRVREIQDLVCRLLKVRRMDLLSARRDRMSVMARQVGMYLCKRHTGASFPELGRRFGGRDHTTVLHAIARVEKVMATPMGIAVSKQWRSDDCDLMRDAVSLAEVTISTWPARPARARYRHALRAKQP